MDFPTIPTNSLDFRAYVNSLQRTSGTDSDFTYTILLPKRQTGYEFNRVCLVTCSIPKTYYTVLDGQGTFQWQEGNDPIVTVNIPKGCYSRTGFLTYLSGYLTANSGKGWTYTTSVSNKSIGPDTGIVTYTVAGSGSSGNVKFITGTSNISDQLGLEDNTTYTFTGQNLIAPNVSVFQAEFTLFLHSNCVDEEVNILGSIFLGPNQPDYSLIAYNSFNPKLAARRLTQNQSTVYSFSLTDENGGVISTNGVTLVFELLFWHEDDRLDKIIYLLMEQNKLLSRMMGEQSAEENDLSLGPSTQFAGISSNGPLDNIPKLPNPNIGYSTPNPNQQGATKLSSSKTGYSTKSPEEISEERKE